MFQFRPQTVGNVKYNEFANPFYSVHRDLAYNGTTMLSSALKFLNKSNEFKESEMVELCKVIYEVFTKKTFNSPVIGSKDPYHEFNKVLLSCGYYNLSKNIRDKFEKSLGDMCMYMIFNSISEANLGTLNQNIATYERAWENLMKMEIEKRLGVGFYMRKILFNLLYLVWKVVYSSLKFLKTLLRLVLNTAKTLVKLVLYLPSKFIKNLNSWFKRKSKNKELKNVKKKRKSL